MSAEESYQYFFNKLRLWFELEFLGKTEQKKQTNEIHKYVKIREIKNKLEILDTIFKVT